jgi:nucleotide-binding universal stress UspA family protein
MYKKILSAVSEHLNSEIATRYALNLARVCGAKLYICFIAEKDMPKPRFDKAEEAMKMLFLEAEKMGL